MPALTILMEQRSSMLSQNVLQWTFFNMVVRGSGASNILAGQLRNPAVRGAGYEPSV